MVNSVERETSREKLCKRSKFDLMVYDEIESKLENESYKILKDFEVQTHHLIHS